jgi:hypothetical protein
VRDAHRVGVIGAEELLPEGLLHAGAAVGFHGGLMEGGEDTDG